MNENKKRAAVTLGIALGVNLTVTVLKGAAAAVTGSVGTAAECAHSAVDTTNQILMGFGLWRSQRTGKAHLEYVWGVAAAGAMFVTGGVWAVYDGFRSLLAPEVGSGLVWAVSVLVLSMALESVSFARTVTELCREKGELGFWEYLRVTPNVSTKATFYEDGTDIGGDLLALAGLTLAAVTGLGGWDAGAAILIGVVVGWLATTIARHNIRLWKATVAVAV